MYIIAKTEREFDKVAEKRDVRLVGLLGEEVKLNGSIYRIAGFTDRKCKFTVYVEDNFGGAFRITTTRALNTLVNEEAQEMVEKESCFVKYNANPKGRNIGDCFLRAYSKAHNISWEEAFMKVGTYAMQNGYTMDSAEMIEELMKAEKNELFYELGDVHTFTKNAPKGSYLVGVSGHVVAVVDNQYFDTWDCGNKKITEIYKIS